MWNLPNTITIIRIALTPVIALLPFIEGYWPKFLAFVIFAITALTDLVDGYLARSRGEVTNLGKLLDPLADKLLLVAALVPIYWIASERQDLYGIPFWGSIPLWVCLLLLGRELAMTVFRRFAQKRGVVIAAGSAGKLKTTIQNIFIGAILAWFAFRDAARSFGWQDKPFGRFWTEFHGGFVAVALALAAVLTVYSFVIYLYRYRSVFSTPSR
jgi:CDP-diacylglycerol--glycerol-3-phosphate 3-phosphatidyltransferase